MPRAVKVKNVLAAAGARVAKKKPAGGKRNKLYAMPEKITEGTVLTDMAKGQWCIGPSIGTGGFGEIYSASRMGEKSYDYVVKCEPHGNGPLFVEMHFYMRNAKLEDIQRFKNKRGLEALGMPYMIGNGSVEVNGQKHRFIVMPRYGSDMAHHFLENGRRLQEGTAYRLALQMLDVYEFIHSCGYVHADLKAANILLGYGQGGGAQAYLVDYGLASHYTIKEFKPDPKKMHNGTIEYTSRDAHQGVATMRADLEILGYNLIEWLGVQLPWVQKKLLVTPAKVQQAKEEFMTDVGANLKQVFEADNVPAPISDFMKYVAKMKYNEKPEYQKCRKMFESALKAMKITNKGDLDVKMKNSTNNNAASTSKAKGKIATKLLPYVDSSASEEEICASDDDDGDVIFEAKRSVKVAPTKKLITTTKTGQKIASPPGKVTRKISPLKTTISPGGKRVVSLNKLTTGNTPSKAATRPSPTHKKRASPVISSIRARLSPTCKKTKPDINDDNEHTPRTESSRSLRSTPVKAKANINFSPAITLSRPTTSSSSSLTKRHGKTVINDNLTPNSSAGITYELNLEVDISMDANVIVNVKRKKKTPHAAAAAVSSPRINGRHSRSRSHTADTEEGAADTPVARVRVRKLDSADDGCSNSYTPAVEVKKAKL